jgi:hypothetical protein
MFQHDANQRRHCWRPLMVFTIGFLGILMSLGAFAQSAAENRHQTVLRELELTPAEEKVFWPIYDAYAKELLQVFEETAEVAYRLFQIREKVSDAMADEYTDALLKGELRQAQIHLDYQPKFRAILDARRTARLFQFERRLTSYMSTEISREFPLIR